MTNPLDLDFCCPDLPTLTHKPRPRNILSEQKIQNKIIIILDVIKHINKAFLIEVLPGSALTVSAMLVHCVGTKGAKPFFVRRLKRESQPAKRWLSRKPPLWSSHTSSLHVATRGSCLHIWLLFSQREEYLNSGRSKKRKRNDFVVSGPGGGDVDWRTRNSPRAPVSSFLPCIPCVTHQCLR